MFSVASEGGDWALQRTGAITLEGTEDFTVADSLFEKVSVPDVLFFVPHLDH